MPDGTHDAKRRETLLRLPIGELTTWHLVVTCPACMQDRYLPIGELVDRCGPDSILVMLVPKLRCSEPACRTSPSKVRLRNRYTA